MAVSLENIRLARESLPVVHANAEPLAMTFYVNLFAIAPAMRALFRDDLGGQSMRFITTLTTIVELLDAREAFDRAMDRLAFAHARLGVKAEHYAPMGHALMVTLGETLGPEFTEVRLAAWRAAYNHVAAEMIARGCR